MYSIFDLLIFDPLPWAPVLKVDFSFTCFLSYYMYFIFDLVFNPFHSLMLSQPSCVYLLLKKWLHQRMESSWMPRVHQNNYWTTPEKTETNRNEHAVYPRILEYYDMSDPILYTHLWWGCYNFFIFYFFLPFFEQRLAELGRSCHVQAWLILAMAWLNWS